jgi:hypothetical protein
VRDVRSIKHTKIKNIVMAQRVMGYGNNEDEYKYFCRAIFWIYGARTNKINLTVIPEALIAT